VLELQQGMAPISFAYRQPYRSVLRTLGMAPISGSKE